MFHVISILIEIYFYIIGNIEKFKHFLTEQDFQFDD